MTIHGARGAAQGKSPGASGRLPLGRALAGTALVLLVLFAVLYDNGALLAPLVGESAYAKNYLHEFFHDARHLLGVPGH